MTRMEAAALAWYEAKAQAARLRHLRVMQECDFCPTASDDPSRPPKPDPHRAAPCFRDFCVDVGPEDPPTTQPVVEWCPSCQRRQEIHEQYQAATKARGIASRSLQALCRAAIKRGAA